MSCGPQMPAMPLSMVKAGETVRVSRVKGNEDMKHHLKDLGFVEGNEIHVVSSSGANIIVTVLGVLAILTCLGVDYPWLIIGIPAIPSLYFDWFSGCIQAFIFCTMTTLFIKQAAG